MTRIKRAEAKRLGLERYFTGKPCPQGHIVERRVSTFSCVECSNYYNARHRERHPARLNSMAMLRLVKTKYPDSYMPGTTWQTFVELYDTALKRSHAAGVQYHVDHIIPLSAGGLHSLNNLQIITAEENVRKGGVSLYHIRQLEKTVRELEARCGALEAQLNNA